MGQLLRIGVPDCKKTFLERGARWGNCLVMKSVPGRIKVGKKEKKRPPTQKRSGGLAASIIVGLATEQSERSRLEKV